MLRSVASVALAGVVVLMICPGAPPSAAAQAPTPEMRGLDRVSEPGHTLYYYRAEVGGHVVGVGVSCRGRASLVTVFFGGFPYDRRAVQFSVRRADGYVERFGPVVEAGPEHGFHSPQITNAARARRFLDVAFEDGALVSNGYRSFRNRLGPAENARWRSTLLACFR